jgi:hypothetical protein
LQIQHQKRNTLLNTLVLILIARQTSRFLT